MNKIVFSLVLALVLGTTITYGLSWTVTQHDNSNCGNNCRWYISNQGSTFTAKVEDDARYGAGGIVAILNQDLPSTTSAIKISYNVNNVGSCGSGYYPITYLFVLNKGSICSDPFHDSACTSDSNRKEIFRYTSSESQTYYFKYSDGSLKIYTDSGLSNLIKAISLSSLSGNSRYLMFYLYTDNNGCGQPFYSSLSVTDTSEIYSNAQPSPNQKDKGSSCDVKKPQECPDEAQNCIPYGNVNNRVCWDMPFVTGDGYCWRDGGENAQNSPADCGATPPCQDECSFGGVRCDGNKIIGCKDVGDSDPCKEKYPVDDCGSKGMICDGGLCKSETCYNECDKLGYTCKGNNLYSCDRNEKGCFYLTFLKSCKSSEICSSDRGNCIKNCPNECNFGSYCGGNRYVSCGDMDNDGCREETVINCKSDEVCVRAVGTGYQCVKMQGCHVDQFGIPVPNGNIFYCSEKCKCGEGEGQCYSDDDCNERLQCVRNVGSKHGLACLSDVCEPKKTLTNPTQYPTILVNGHSFTSGEYNLNNFCESGDYESFRNFQKQLEDDGLMLNKGYVFVNEPIKDVCQKSWDRSISIRTTYYIHGSKKDDSIYFDETLDIEGYAKDFAKVVEIVKNCTNSDKVNIITHSLGGLVAAKFIEQGGEKSVNTLITLGTPHKGLVVETNIGCKLFNRMGQKECDDMLEGSDFIDKMSDYQIPKSIKLFTIAGTNPAVFIKLISGVNLNRGPSDGIVLVKNAHLDYATKYNVFCTHTELPTPNCQEAYDKVKQILEGSPISSNVKTDSSVPTAMVTNEPPKEKQQEPLTKEQPQGIGKITPTQIKEIEDTKSDEPQTQKPEEKQQTTPLGKLFSWFFEFLKR